MGLDAVELVIDVEEEFKIKINDRDAEKILTVGQLHDYVVERLPPASPFAVTRAGEAVPSTPCLTAAAFYRVRRTFVEVLGQARSDIKPSTPIDEHLPVWRRGSLWKRLRKKLGFQTPGIGHSTRTHLIMALVSAIAAIAATFISATDGQSIPFFWLFGSFAATYLALYLALRPFASHIEHVRTFGDLSRWIVLRDYDAICAAVGEQIPQSVWGRLVAIVSYQLSVDPTTIRPESSFVNDLGAS